MTVTSSQEAAFTGATTGLSMSDFQLTILLILYSILYLWVAWVVVTQWKAWGNRKIDFYNFLMRSVRAVLITLLASFFLI